MKMVLSDLDGMSLFQFGELVEAWNAVHGDGSAKLSDREAEELSSWLDEFNAGFA